MLQNLLQKSNGYVQFLRIKQQVKFSQLSTPLTTNAAPTNNDIQLEQSHIDEVLRLNPNLTGVPIETWHRVHDALVNHGLYTSNFLRIVSGNPAVLKRSTKSTINSIEEWRSCQFGEKLLYLLLTKYPELLDVQDGHRLRTRISYLKAFAGTSRNVWKLLMNSPDLMEQPVQRINDKVAYLQQVMRIELPEIVKSEALSQTLEDLRYRHVFLDRLGMFKPRPPKADPNEPTKNPRLYQITDTSEKTFATKICHVSLIEFETFKELYEREQQRKLDAMDEAEFSDDD